MRVLFSAFKASPAGGTEAANSWHLVNALARQGIKLSLLTSTGIEDLDGDEIPANVEIHTVPVPPHPRWLPPNVGVYARYVSWQRASLTYARMLCRDRSHDVVHHYSWGQLAFGTPLSRLDLPLVFGPVGGGSVVPRSLKSYLPIRQRPFEATRALAIRSTRFNPLVASTLKRSSVVIAANTDTQRIIQRPAITVMPDQTPVDLLKASVTRDGPHGGRLLWLGRLLPRKGVLLALDVAAQLPTGFSLQIAGDGPELTRAQSYAKSMGIGPKVRFLGHVTRDKIGELLDDSDALLFTSLRDTSGTQLLEAAARGVPILGINHQGIGDFVPKDGGRLVPLDQADHLASELATAATDLLESPHAWKAASIAARSFAEQHNSSHLAEAVASAYQEAVKTGRCGTKC